MNDLKPCPFCGGKARLFVNGGVRVICSKCCVGTMILTDSLAYESNAVETVIKAWNRRGDVVHGQWVTHYRSGTTVAEGYVSTCCDMWNNRKSDYCPNCGAMMDGGADNGRIH